MNKLYEYKYFICSIIFLSISGPSAKSRWGNIRDNFRKSVKKNKTVSGQKAKIIKQYKYAQQLSFITKFFDERDTMSNIDDKVANEYINVDDDYNEPNENEEYSRNCTTEEVDNPVIVESQNSCPLPSLKQSGSSQFSIPRKKTKYSVPDTPPSKTAAATVMEYLVKKNESMVPLEPKHPVDAFLSGIAPVLKKLTPRYWHYAKSDIFAAVQNYELKMIMDQEQFAQPSPISTYSTSSYSEQSSPAADHPTPTTSSFTNSLSDQNQDFTAYFQKY